MARFCSDNGITIDRCGKLIVVTSPREVVVETTAGPLPASVAVNCAGLWSDRVARLHGGGRPSVVIVPFRGDYYDIDPARGQLITRLVYLVPNPLYPFLGVHLTRSVHGGLHAGPNAVLALGRAAYSWREVSVRDTVELATFPGMWRLGRRYWREGAREMYRSARRHAFGQALRRLVPSIEDRDLPAFPPLGQRRMPALEAPGAAPHHLDGALRQPCLGLGFGVEAR